MTTIRSQPACPWLVILDSDHHLASAAAGGSGWLAMGVCRVSDRAGTGDLDDGDVAALAGSGAVGWREEVNFSNQLM
ncbi:hypothetical protein [Chloroflexus sp.]|uniref:hypothetical protein n=1 Tax=Chloroflexus sp. TaxID=1904827 RepID=UPI00298ED214|nr:hypothetical protein [Chloroflexus sp.]MCS6889093.1 hypothetical protein [Chloroflexus sp.]MDW8405183.1 hypothetical protein [Chloroflexus sp.]